LFFPDDRSTGAGVDPFVPKGSGGGGGSNNTIIITTTTTIITITNNNSSNSCKNVLGLRNF